MIRTTYNEVEFFECIAGDIIIYGAGNSGYWIGRYMDMCSMDYLCYVDSQITKEEVYLNERKVISPRELRRFDNKKLRIILSPNDFESVLKDLFVMDIDMGWDIVCIIPYYEHRFFGYKTYDINRFLGYFRNKLLDNKAITFISNDCTAGEIYKLLDMEPSSPTYYMIIPLEHYIKFLSNIEHYTNLNMKEMYWMKNAFQRDKKQEYPVGKIDDIEIWFVHDKSIDEARNRWNELSKQFKSDNNNVFILSEPPYHPPLTERIISSFDEINTWKKMILLRGKQTIFLNRMCNLGSDTIYMTETWFRRRDTALENQFNILEWLSDD